MNWIGILLVASIGLVIAAAVTALLSGRRPGWSATRRVLTAALVAPLLILLGAGAGILLTGDPAAEGFDGLIVGALLQIGAVGAAIAFAAGLPAAIAAERGLRE